MDVRIPTAHENVRRTEIYKALSHQRYWMVGQGAEVLLPIPVLIGLSDATANSTVATIENITQIRGKPAHFIPGLAP